MLGKRNQQTTRKKERKGKENRKIKSDPFNAYTDAYREAKDESIASIYAKTKRKKQMDIDKKKRDNI